MTTEFRIGVDWTRKGIICWDAWPGDALNLLPKPLTYTTVDWRTTNVTSAVRSKVDSPYGFHAFAVQTGTGVNAGLVLGEEDVTLDVDTIPVDASSAYSAAVWLRGMKGQMNCLSPRMLWKGIPLSAMSASLNRFLPSEMGLPSPVSAITVSQNT